MCGDSLMFHRFLIALATLLAVFGMRPAQADVLDSAANGFTVRHQVDIAAERMQVYGLAAARVDGWWRSDHTVSGDAANLYIETTIPGCFCERLGEDGGLVHMTVSFVNPGTMLRFTGGLGPLGLMGVSGNMTWEFEDSETGTRVTLQYAVGGYLEGGLDAVAGPVDAVLTEQLNRLKSYAEFGDPGQG
jgi:hypothetical protein